MFVWKTRQIFWILFLRLVRLETELIQFFPQSFVEKVDKNQNKKNWQRSLSHIHNSQQNYRSPHSLTRLPADYQDFLYYWKLIKIVSELASWTGSLKFGVSLKHFIGFAKPWLQLLRTNSSLLFLFETRVVIITGVLITDELANNNN